MKIRPIYELEAIQFKNKNFEEIKKWLERHDYTVLKFEEHEHDDYADDYEVIIYNANSYYECEATPIKDNWYLIINNFNLLETCSSEAFERDYKIISK